MITRNKLVSILVMVFAAALFAAKADWTATGKHQAYPMEMYFVGVGLSEKGLDAAKQNAVVEVKKQISVKVSATTLDELTSYSVAGTERTASKSESRARLTTSGDVQGIQVVETVKKGKLFYA